MKPKVLLVLLASHALFVALGAWFATHENRVMKPAVVQTKASPTTPKRMDSVQSPNPVFRASAADFRAAWRQMILGTRSASGEPHWNSINFFCDWCKVDPEGAVRGLSVLYSPRFAHNHLSNAVGESGAELAPVLADHWRELRFMPAYKVEFVLGRSLNALAKRDPLAAAGLAGGLPSSVRGGIYSSMFEQLDGAAIRQIVDHLPAGGPNEDGERGQLWTAVASAVDSADPERGLWDWMARADSPEARHAFVWEGLRKAVRSEKWSAFFDAVDRMDPGAQEEARKVLGEMSFGVKTAADISGECRRRGRDDWTAGARVR